MQLYVNFKHLQKAEAPTYQARNVSVLQGCGGGRQGHGGCGSGRPGGPNSHAQGLVPQDEINRQTHIVNKHYSTSEYNKFTLAKKARLWQLKNPGRTPGSQPSSGRKTQRSLATVAKLTTAVRFVSAAASAISELTAVTTKRTAAEDGGTNDDDQVAATNPV